MSSWSNWPSYNQFISSAWGWTDEVADPTFSLASNIVIGTNPPYSANDFLAFYPQFGGNPATLSGVISQGSAVITNTTTTGILPGQPLANATLLGNGQYNAGCFPSGTTVISIDSANQMTVSSPATMSGTIFAIYNAPFVPFLVLNAYIALASASLVQARWLDMWPVAMALYVAHFCTLYIQCAGSAVSSAGQLAQQGLARGIKVSKGAGPASVGIQPSTQGGGLSEWGSWTETSFGVQLATFARIVGSGPVFIW